MPHWNQSYLDLVSHGFQLQPLWRKRLQLYADTELLVVQVAGNTALMARHYGLSASIISIFEMFVKQKTRPAERHTHCRTPYALQHTSRSVLVWAFGVLIWGSGRPFRACFERVALSSAGVSQTSPAVAGLSDTFGRRQISVWGRVGWIIFFGGCRQTP